MERERLTEFFTSMVVYPFLYMHITRLQEASDESVGRIMSSNNKQSLREFPEGKALLSLERWCKEVVYANVWQELAYKYFKFAFTLAQLYLPPLSPSVARALPRNLLSQPWETTLEDQVAHTLSSNPPSPFQSVQDATLPILDHVSRQLHITYRMSRLSTWKESVEVLLWFVSLGWLMVGMVFQAVSMGLRLGSTMAGVMSQALTFVPPASIFFSVVSAILSILAVLANGISTVFYQVAQLINMGKQGVGRTVERVQSEEVKKLRPKVLLMRNLDDVEQVMLRQLKGDSLLRNRPDVPSLDDSMLVKAYDLGLVDAFGNPVVDTLDEVLYRDPFHPRGFFGYSTNRNQKIAAVLLMRILAVKRIMAVMRTDDLRFIFLLGAPDSGKSSLLQHTAADSPHSSPKAMKSAAKAPARLQLVSGTRYTYMVDIPGLSSEDADILRKARTVATAIHHGVVSSLTYVTPWTGDAEQEAVAMSDTLVTCTRLRRPVIICLSKAGKYRDANMEGEVDVKSDEERQKRHAADLNTAHNNWQQQIAHLARQRRLDPTLVTVLLAEFDGTPPLGAFSVEQVKNWVLNQTGPRAA